VIVMGLGLVLMLVIPVVASSPDSMPSLVDVVSGGGGGSPMITFMTTRFVTLPWKSDASKVISYNPSGKPSTNKLQSLSVGLRGRASSQSTSQMSLVQRLSVPFSTPADSSTGE